MSSDAYSRRCSLLIVAQLDARLALLLSSRMTWRIDELRLAHPRHVSFRIRASDRVARTSGDAPGHVARSDV